jgi:hypothetical protein
MVFAKTNLKVHNQVAMDIFEKLKGYISAQVVSNLSGLLGEDEVKVQQGLELSLGAFLASVLKYGTNEKGAKHILDILSDGGHSGEILKNFESFSSMAEKCRLLETIGRNIVNHFMPDRLSVVTEKVGRLSGLKGESSLSLLHLSAPLVLGYLGKTAREENFSPQAFKSYLKEVGDKVYPALPVSIQYALNLPKPGVGSESTHHKAVHALNEKKENWSLIWPWILLVAVGVSIYFFSRNRAGMEQATLTKSEVSIPADTLENADTLVTGVPTIKNTVPVISQPIPEPREEPVKEAAILPKEREEIIPRGFSKVPAEAFASESAEIVGQQSLQPVLTQLERDSQKSLVITPLKSAGRIGEDRAYAIRDYLIENGIPLHRVEVGSVRSGSSSSGVAIRYQ